MYYCVSEVRYCGWIAIGGYISRRQSSVYLHVLSKNQSNSLEWCNLWFSNRDVCTCRLEFVATPHGTLTTHFIALVYKVLLELQIRTSKVMLLLVDLSYLIQLYTETCMSCVYITATACTKSC